MAKQKRISSANPTAETNLPSIISDWVEAIHEFHQWNRELVNLINEHSDTDKYIINYLLKIGNQWSVTDLIQLHIDITDSLNKLLRNIDSMDEKTDIALKIEQLTVHTKTIRRCSERIRNALEIRTFGRLDS